MITNHKSGEFFEWNLFTNCHNVFMVGFHWNSIDSIESNHWLIFDFHHIWSFTNPKNLTNISLCFFPYCIQFLWISEKKTFPEKTLWKKIPIFFPLYQKKTFDNKTAKNKRGNKKKQRPTKTKWNDSHTHTHTQESYYGNDP